MIATLIKKLFFNAPDPRLEALQDELSSIQLSGNYLSGKYQGRQLTIKIKKFELSMELSCQTAIYFEGKNRSKNPAYSAQMPRHPQLPDNVYFSSQDTSTVQSWLDKISDTRALALLFSHNDVELEMKPYKGMLELEWEHFSTSSLSAQQVKELLSALYQVAQSLE